MKLLAIETSCDETAAAVVLVNPKKSSTKPAIKSLSSVVSSQIKIHQKTNGVVPEVAARAHLTKINSVVAEALTKAKTKLKDIDYLAVTAGPGLVTSLLVGTEYVKALSFATGKKIIPTNHMLGHLYSALIKNPSVKLPSINLIVSGGHTYIVLMKSTKNFKVIGQTVDDAAGEAFDKVAKMLGLPYPGGPEISKIAAKGSVKSKVDYNFPRPMQNANNFDFSFAGLKTAVLYKIRDQKLNIKKEAVRINLAYSFQNAAIDVLVSKTIKAAIKFKAKSITLSGGVAANKKLRKDLTKAAKKIGIKVYVPDFDLCTDNALMIANAAAIKLQNGFKPVGFKNLRANPVLEI